MAGCGAMNSAWRLPRPAHGKCEALDGGIADIAVLIGGDLYRIGRGRQMDRAPSGAENPDAAGAMLDHGQDMHLLAVEEISGKEVNRQDPLRLRSQEPA